MLSGDIMKIVAITNIRDLPPPIKKEWNTCGSYEREVKSWEDALDNPNDSKGVYEADGLNALEFVAYFNALEQKKGEFLSLEEIESAWNNTIDGYNNMNVIIILIRYWKRYNEGKIQKFFNRMQGLEEDTAGYLY